MAQTLADNTIKVESGDTLYNIYGPNWKEASGYTGDPTKLAIGTILPSPKNTGIITADTLNGPQSPVILPEKPIAEPSGVSVAPTDYTAFLKTFLESSTPPPSSADAYAKVSTEAGMDEKTKKVADLTAQLNDITAGQQVQELQIGKEPISAGAIQGRNIELERNNAIRALPIQAQLAAAQGNLTLAQNKLDTLFKLKSEDARATYDYNKDLRAMVYDYATKQEQARLDKQAKKDDREFTLYRDSIDNLQALAESAMDNGQADVAAQIMALDPKSPTFKADLAKLQAKIVNPTAELDRQLKQLQIAKAKAELITPPSTAISTDTNTNDKTISTINGLLESGSGILEAVGPNILARFGLGSLTGKTQNFVSSVEQIVSQLSLDKLIEAKAKGATFGALSDREMNILAGAATKIAGWQIKDKNGKVKGYNIDQNSFNEELKVIQEMAQKDKELKLGISGTSSLSDYLNNVDSALGTSNPYSTYIKE